MTQKNIAQWTRLPLVLASGSPRRSQILSTAGFSFSVRPVDVDEESMFCTGPNSTLAVDVARAKAEAATRAPGSGECIITADTVVSVDGQALGKPLDKTDARRMLKLLRGRSHDVITGVTVAADDLFHTTSVTTEVSFRDYSEREMEAYVASGSPMDKAGGYGIQDVPFRPAASYSGCYLNVVGLPICGLADLLRRSRIIAADTSLSCDGHRP